MSDHDVPTDVPAFPGVAISRGDSFMLIRSLDALATPTRRALRRFYRDLHIFDSSGSLWPVELVGVEHQGMLRSLFGSTVRARLRLGKPKADAMKTAVQWLCELVDADPDDIYCQHVSGDALKARFQACIVPAELIECASGLPKDA